jgi:hypothetical protein
MHRRGGIPVTAAAEARPDLISGLVYLAAFLPRSGETVLDLFPKDTDSLLPPSLDADFEAGWEVDGAPGVASTTSGSACLTRSRTRASVSPRQSPSSAILASISWEGDFTP